MKKKINYLLLLIILPVIVSSCENDILYNGKETTPKLTLNAFIDADSPSNRLYLSLTGKSQTTQVSQATVEVRVNGELKETVRPVADQEGTPHAEITTRFKPADEVRIDVHTDNSEYHAWIEETIPHSVDIVRIDTVKPHWIAPNAYKQLRFQVRFKDRPKEKNYYRIVVEQRETVKGIDAQGQEQSKTFKYYDYWPWEDLALTDGRPINNPEELDSELFERVTNFYGVFDDSWFKDGTYFLYVQVMLYNPYYSYSYLGFTPQTFDVDVAVRLLAITETEYYYLNTMNIIDSGIMEEYLSDPIRIPSNVQGGTGIVGFSTGYPWVYQIVRDKEVEYYSEY